MLGQRSGLRAYLAKRLIMGIPLLHPWANRLAARRFRVADRDVVLVSQSRPMAPFVLACGSRRIALSLIAGYWCAQVYAPADDDVIAFEPMTASTNALVTGGPDLQLLAPGDTHRATFSLTVTDV